MANKKTNSWHMPNRRYGLLFFYLGLACLIIAAFINFVYIRPTHFKQQFKQHQLQDCLRTSTSHASCEAHFDH